MHNRALNHSSAQRWRARPVPNNERAAPSISGVGAAEDHLQPTIERFQRRARPRSLTSHGTTNIEETWEDINKQGERRIHQEQAKRRETDVQKKGDDKDGAGTWRCPPRRRCGQCGVITRKKRTQTHGETNVNTFRLFEKKWR